MIFGDDLDIKQVFLKYKNLDITQLTNSSFSKGDIPQFWSKIGFLLLFVF